MKPEGENGRSNAASEQKQQRAKTRLMAECSRKEISSGQARALLEKYLIPKEQAEGIVNFLIAEKYIDDERFAKAYTRDKLRFSKWGPEKIFRGLSDAGVEKSIAEEAVNQQEDLAIQVLADLLSKKRKDLEKKAEKKADEDRSKLESLEQQLEDLDRNKNISKDKDIKDVKQAQAFKDYYKQKTALQRKIYALQTKFRNSSLQTKASLIAYARTKGFPSKLIEKAIKDI